MRKRWGKVSVLDNVLIEQKLSRTSPVKPTHSGAATTTLGRAGKVEIGPTLDMQLEYRVRSGLTVVQSEHTLSPTYP